MPYPDDVSRQIYRWPVTAPEPAPPYIPAGEIRADLDAFDAEIERRHPRPSGWLILIDGDCVPVGRVLERVTATITWYGPLSEKQTGPRR